MMASDERIERILRAVNQSLSQINARLTELENRVDQNQGKMIMEEKTLPEAESLLGGKTVFASEDGRIQKIKYIAVCDYCHLKLDENNFVVCSSCGKKVCQRCAISLDGSYVCPECFKTEYPISRQCYQILTLLQNNISETGDMVEVTGMSESEVCSALGQLFECGYIVREGVSIFSRIRVTEKGLTVLIIHGRLLSKDMDIAHFHERLNALGEKV